MPDAKANIRMTPEELKKLKMFCLQNDTTVQAFLKNAMEYCVKNKILPEENK